MDFGTAILYVLAVLAIIGVAGFIVYALAGLTISVIDKKNVKLFSGSNENSLSKEDQKLLLADNDYQVKLEEDEKKEEEKKPAEKQPEENHGEAKEVTSQVDFDAADDEKREIDSNKNALNEREQNLNSNTDDSDEEENNDDEDLEAMYQKLIADINTEATATEKEEAVEEPKVEEIVEEPKVEETVEEPKVEEVVEEEPKVKEVVEEEPKVEEKVVDDEKVKDLQTQLEELKAQLQAEQAEKDAIKTQNDELAKKLQEKPIVETQIVETESLESLIARRDMLNQRLADSEKELKSNKKEYIPLAKIKRNLETDKAKLRRKEAIVAKQKVVLFGVNNYVVDPKKEKKLSEDLDVLDALRLSVQHCEEVMKNNEDRYPILEKTNGILTKQVEQTKTDIADLEARIAKLQTNGSDTSAK